MKKSLTVIFILSFVSIGFAAAMPPQNLKVEFDAVDANKIPINISLHPTATELQQITDAQFAPSPSNLLLILEKNGNAYAFNYSYNKNLLQVKNKRLLFKRDVLTQSEQGLLGAAFHPQFSSNGYIFIHYSTTDENRKRIGRIARVTVDNPKNPQQVTSEKTILEVRQPYVNHNAGQLLFGEDGYLYIGFGDGGAANDPHNYAQNPQTFLGKILRIDVNNNDNNAYAIPKDNPFVNNSEFLPEIWNIGLRNPWRFTFTADNNLIIADVGQNQWEEIDIAVKGDNLGWSFKEGSHCFKNSKHCEREDLIEPIYDYSHDEGASVTGGYIATNENYNKLQQKYIFGDYVSGRLWALTLPTTSKTTVKEVFALGKWQMLAASFAKDNQGNVFVADHNHETLWQIVEIK